jgi:hypothetical protein
MFLLLLRKLNVFLFDSIPESFKMPEVKCFVEGCPAKTKKRCDMLLHIDACHQIIGYGL